VAVENDKARVSEATRAAPAAPVSEGPAPHERDVVPEEPEGSPILVIVLSVLGAAGGTFAFLQRRKQADAFSTR